MPFSRKYYLYQSKCLNQTSPGTNVKMKQINDRIHASKKRGKKLSRLIKITAF